MDPIRIDPWGRRSKDRKDKGGGASNLASPTAVAAAHTPSHQKRSDYLEKGLLEHVMDAVFAGTPFVKSDSVRVSNNAVGNQLKVQVR